MGFSFHSLSVGSFGEDLVIFVEPVTFFLCEKCFNTSLAIHAVKSNLESWNTFT